MCVCCLKIVCLSQVQSTVERVIVFLLSQVVERSSEEEALFSLHPCTESCKLLWRDSWVVGFYSFKPKGRMEDQSERVAAVVEEEEDEIVVLFLFPRCTSTLWTLIVVPPQRQNYLLDSYCTQSHKYPLKILTLKCYLTNRLEENLLQPRPQHTS